ncbi:hypothetical protein IWZ00DRAFT_265409 [Phyllosticta capitalensis]
MPARKRALRDIEPEAEAPPAPQPPSKLQQLRNLWEFACLHQYIHIFGDAVKISQDIDIDLLEEECLKPTTSERLPEVGLALLKYVSSHKGLTPEIFDEYARRQYVAKAPQRNPFGVEEEPIKFNDMDTFTKIRVLHQLSVWTLGNADRIKDKMGLTEKQQTSWRVEEFGWDKDDRTYYLLDDDRLYRRSAQPLPPPPRAKPKPKPEPKKTRGTRASKRRRLSTTDDESAAEEEPAVDESAPQELETFGGMTWECVAVTLDEYNDFIESFRKSRDKNEKDLVRRLQSEILPVLEEAAEKKRAQETKKQRELENLEKMAHAKRSSRLAIKQEKQKEEEAAAEAARKRVADLEMARKEQERQKKQEEDRESRMMTREQRLKEREVRRILHEEELKKLEEDRQKAEKNEARLSERHLKAEMQRRQKELEKMQEEETWVFDCAVCGVHGENVDDGSHSIACEKCNVWQHSACHGIAQKDAERDDFHFVCNDCKRKDEPKLPPLKLHMGSPRTTKANIPPAKPPSTAMNGLMNGPSLSPQGQASGPPGIHHQHPHIPPPPHSSDIKSAASPPLGNHPHWQPNHQFMQQNGHVTKVALSPSRPVSQGSSGYPHHLHHQPVAYDTSPSRPISAGYGAPSPSKSASGPASSPFGQSNGYARFNPPPFSSPNPAYPPPQAAQTPSFSPMKHAAPASSPPSMHLQQQHHPHHHLSHSPSSQQFVHGSSHLLPAAAGGISPEKHDASHSAALHRQSGGAGVAGAAGAAGAGPAAVHHHQPPPPQPVPVVLPPIAPLAPSANPPILTPPSKKAPEQQQYHYAAGSHQTLPLPGGGVGGQGGGGGGVVGPPANNMNHATAVAPAAAVANSNSHSNQSTSAGGATGAGAEPGRGAG